jgi:hypothetical protein
MINNYNNIPKNNSLHFKLENQILENQILEQQDIVEQYNNQLAILENNKIATETAILNQQTEINNLYNALVPTINKNIDEANITINTLNNSSTQLQNNLTNLTVQSKQLQNNLTNLTVQSKQLQNKKINILTKLLLICFVVVGWIILAIKYYKSNKLNATTTNKLKGDKSQLKILEKQIESTQNNLNTILQQKSDIEKLQAILSRLTNRSDNLANINLNVIPENLKKNVNTLQMLQANLDTLQTKQQTVINDSQTLSTAITDAQQELLNLKNNVQNNFFALPPKVEQPQYQPVICKYEYEVEDYLINLAKILGNITENEIITTIDGIKKSDDYLKSSEANKYDILLSRSLALLNFSSQLQLLYYASGLNKVADNQSNDYDIVHIYYNWVFEKLVNQIDKQSPSYLRKVPQNYQDAFLYTVERESCNAYPLDQLIAHSQHVINFLHNIKLLASLVPNLRLEQYTEILQNNFDKLTTNQLNEQECNEIANLIKQHEQNLIDLANQDKLIKTITLHTKITIDNYRKKNQYSYIHSYLLLTLLDAHISDIIKSLDITVNNNEPSLNLVDTVLNQLNQILANNNKIFEDKLLIENLKYELQTIYNKTVSVAEDEDTKLALINGLKIIQLSNVAQEDQEAYNAIKNNLNGAKAQYQTFENSKNEIQTKITDCNNNKNYQYVIELENEIAKLIYKPVLDKEYNRFVAIFYRDPQYQAALSADELDHLDFNRKLDS